MSEHETRNVWGQHIIDFIREERQNENLTNLSIVCKDGKRLSMHKLIFCIYNVNLKNLMNDDDSDLIIMPETEYTVIKKCLDYLYVGEADIGTNEMLLEFESALEQLGIKDNVKNSIWLAMTVRTNAVHLPKFQFPEDDYPFSSDFESRENIQIKPELFDDVKQETPKEEATYKCYRCDFSTKYPDNLRRHKIRHEGGTTFECDQCDFKAAYLSAVTVHKAVKHEGLRFHCEVCGKSYTSKRSLKLHYESVHEKNTYMCTVCGFKASTLVYLNIHTEVTHEGVRYACKDCKYISKDKSNLRYHVSTKHSLNKTSYTCDVCEYKTTSKRNLSQHVKVVHEGLRYKCDKCEYEAKNSGHLKQHQRAIHEGFRYSCKICIFTASFPGDLKRHMKRKHAIQRNGYPTSDEVSEEDMKNSLLKDDDRSAMPMKNPSPGDLFNNEYVKNFIMKKEKFT